MSVGGLAGGGSTSTLVLSSLPKQKTSNEDIKEAPAALKTLLLFTCPNLTAGIPPWARSSGMWAEATPRAVISRGQGWFSGHVPVVLISSQRLSGWPRGPCWCCYPVCVHSTRT